jgi:hypothetical protein
MVNLLVVDARFYLAPVELAQVTQVDAVLLVVEHVHALARVELERHVLHAQLGLEQVPVVAVGQRQQVVGGFISGGADLIARQRVADAAGEIVVFEVGTGGVVVSLGGRAAVADAEIFCGVSGCYIGSAGLVVAAVKGANPRRA